MTTLLTRELPGESPGRDAPTAIDEITSDDMLGLVSHELQTPLMLIDGNARLLRRSIDEDERSRAIDEIVAASRRMSRLIANMMVLARTGHGDELVCEPLVLRLSFAEAVAEHLRLHPDSTVALETDPQLPPVMGDTTCVDQVLTNLLTNAAKYGSAAEPVRLTAVRDGNYVLVRVANGGEAVDQGSVERLFVPFFRDPGHLRSKPGVGLGLAVCRRLIEALHGRIWASARPGGGLEVCFTLPIAEAD